MGSDRRQGEGAEAEVTGVAAAVAKKIAAKKAPSKKVAKKPPKKPAPTYTRQSLTAIESVVVEYRCTEPECETCGETRATRIPRVGYTILLPGDIMCAVCGRLCEWDRESGVNVQRTGDGSER